MGPIAWLYHLWDTICYIKEHGWAEYREARRKYNEHMRFQGYGDAKYNHRKAIKEMRRAKKRNK